MHKRDRVAAGRHHLLELLRVGHPCSFPDTSVNGIQSIWGELIRELEKEDRVRVDRSG